MAEKTPPHIQVPAAIGKAINQHKGEPCVVLLIVKYESESDWIRERLWMTPGWEQPDLWKTAYKWIHNDAKLLYYDVSKIEAIRFYSFKLV